MTPTILNDVVVSPETSIREALLHISRGGLQIALVVDADRRLIGSFTDGDWRRGLEQDVELSDPVSKVMNPAPITVQQGATPAQTVAVMREHSIRQLPIVDPAGRIVDLVTLDELLRPGRRKSWVMLMAGGLGSRLRPLTYATPKPMLPLGERPILEILIEHLANQGFGRFFISVNYKAEKIEAHFGDGRQLGVSIEYLSETERLGTAGALRLLPDRPSAPILVMNSDILTTLDAGRLVDFHVTGGAPATICAREHVTRIPYGVLKIGADGKYAGMVEKPVRNDLISAGINVLSPECLALLGSAGPVDMPALMDRVHKSLGAPTVYRMKEYWLDIGQIEDLERAQSEVNDLFTAD